MTKHATGSFEVKSWNEKPYSEIDGQLKLTRADVIYTYHGDLEGEGRIEYLMCYSTNNIAYFIGYEQVTGRLGNRSGSFVFQHVGTYEAGAVKDTLTVVPGSAMGNLSGLQGSGVSGGDGEATFTLDYEIANGQNQP
ncbi:MAG: DUF3224 domain-containing protein [Ktedonobacteraceae bacterium]|nr:DUF3224 domain-containing protein [Ktedonobacteraceae bacterium]